MIFYRALLRILSAADVYYTYTYIYARSHTSTVYVTVCIVSYCVYATNWLPACCCCCCCLPNLYVYSTTNVAVNTLCRSELTVLNAMTCHAVACHAVPYHARQLYTINMWETHTRLFVSVAHSLTHSLIQLAHILKSIRALFLSPSHTISPHVWMLLCVCVL